MYILFRDSSLIPLFRCIRRGHAAVDIMQVMEYIADQMLSFPLGAAVFHYKTDFLVRQIESIFGILPVADLIGKRRLSVFRGKRLTYQLV